MADRKRAPRLGRGLSSLMGTAVPVTAPAPGKPEAADGPAAQKRAEASVAAKSTATQTTAKLAPETSSSAVTDDPGGLDSLWYLPVDVIKPNPHQPRRNFAEGGLRRLAESIKSDGLMQPIVVRPSGGGPLPASTDDPTGSGFELVAGERRWRAARLAGLRQVPAILR